MTAGHDNDSNPAGWTCRPCNSSLVRDSVALTCDGASVNVELPCCPKCGKPFISPEFASGLMLETEQDPLRVK